MRYGPGANSLAVLNGQGPGKPLSADLVPTNTPLHAGRDLRHQRTAQTPTSPADIPVATVVPSANGATASQESVTLQPLADLAHLRYVSVLVYGPSS